MCVFEVAIADEIAMMPNAPPIKNYLYDALDSIGEPVSIHSVIKEVFAGEVRVTAADRGARVRGDTKPGFAVRERERNTFIERTLELY